MKNVFKNVDWKKVGTFAGGFVFGTAGVKVLASDDAKKVYTQCTAAVLRAKECVMKTVNLVQENCEDILEGAKDINEERAQKAEAQAFEDEDFREVEDATEETTEETAE